MNQQKKKKKGPETNGWLQTGVYSKQTARMCAVLYMLIWVQLDWAGAGQWELSCASVGVLRLMREKPTRVWHELHDFHWAKRSSMRGPAAPREHRVHLLPPVIEQKRHWGRTNTDIKEETRLVTEEHITPFDLRLAWPQIRRYIFNNNIADWTENLEELTSRTELVSFPSGS